LAATLWFIPKYHAAAVPVAFLATVFIVEVVGSLRQRMVQVAHDWRRYRVLVGAGSLLALGVGLMVGLAGGGIWALVVQPPLFGVPAAVDLFVIKKWRPDWSWSWVRYRETAIFGANRIGAGALYNGRLVIEQGRIAGVFDLTTLGMFTRSLGLATLVSGRVGAVAVEALYPVLTRAEARSAHFQRMADLVLRGVCWLTIAAGVYLAINADDIVALLYGSRWRPVASLLPTSVAVVATGGISSAVSSLLLANNNVRESLLLSFLASGTAIALALVLVPFGTTIYLGALASQGVLMVVLSLSFLLLSRGATIWGVAAALGPAAITAFLSVSSVVLLRSIGAGGNGLLLRLLVSGLVLGVSHLIVMRGFFSRLLGELLDVAPFGSILARSLVLRSAAVSIAL
jgi:O-antigen/teichoic acid export membrane protein